MNSTLKCTLPLPPLGDMIAFELDNGVDSESTSSHGQAVGPKPVNQSAGPESSLHPLAAPPDFIRSHFWQFHGHDSQFRLAHGYGAGEL